MNRCSSILNSSRWRHALADDAVTSKLNTSWENYCNYISYWSMLRELSTFNWNGTATSISTNLIVKLSDNSSVVIILHPLMSQSNVVSCSRPCSSSDYCCQLFQAVLFQWLMLLPVIPGSALPVINVVASCSGQFSSSD